MTNETNSSTKPVYSTRINAIEAAVWANEVEGKTLYSVTITRNYRDKKTEKFCSTSSFGYRDLLTVAKVADNAHSWIASSIDLERITKREFQ